MQVIIAEKPSLGRNIIKALEMTGEKFSKKDGYQISDNYAVTWCFGHLFALQDMDIYLYGQPHQWNMDDIPFFPEKFKFVLKQTKNKNGIASTDKGVKKQFEIIQTLLEKSDSAVNAGDADREGQVIVDLVIAKVKYKKPVYRLWVSDQTPETIKASISNLKPDSKYKNILEEGLTRTYMDWLYGINLTRLATLKAHTLLRVGRVIVPVVQEIVARDKSIEEFVPEDYFKCVSSKEYDGINLELTSKNTFKTEEKNKADELCQSYNESGGTVTSLKKEKKTVHAPKLFSMSTLQAFLSDSLNMKDVLAATQKLYEEGYVSYPRTDAEYLFSSEKDKVKNIIKNYPECIFKDEKQIFNDAKNADMSHSAIIPTAKVSKHFSGDEELVYNAILNRFRAVFWKEDMTVDRTTMVINVNGEDFKITGDIIRSQGWNKAEPSKKKSKILPDFTEGQKIPVSFKKKKATTSPPKHYTTAELLSFMKNPFKKEEQTDVQLGTEATRAGIIDNAIQSGYIALKKKSYYAMDKGKMLVETINDLNFGIDKRQSLQFADILVKIRNGEATEKEAIAMTEKTIRKIFNDSGDKKVKTMSTSIGTCPVCGGDILKKKSKENKNIYICENYGKGCKFFMNEVVDRFGDKIKMNDTKMSTLLNGGTVKETLTSKSGKKYTADVKFEVNGQYVNIKPVFTESKPLGVCPVCGKPVRKRGMVWVCDDHKTCPFVIFEKMNYYKDKIPMNDEKVKTLLNGGAIDAKISTKSGKKIDAKLVLKMNGQYTNLEITRD